METNHEGVKLEKVYHKREGHDYLNGAEWENTKVFNKQDKSEEVLNKAKDKNGAWSETYSKKGKERWSSKEGFRGN